MNESNLNAPYKCLFYALLQERPHDHKLREFLSLKYDFDISNFI